MGQSQGSVWVRGGTVVNADRQEKADVLCVDGAIAAVGPDVAALVPAGAQVIDASGQFVMPGGIGASRWGGDEYAERFHESPYEPAIGHRFVPFDDCPPVVRSLIAHHASRLVAALLRDFQVLAS